MQIRNQHRFLNLPQEAIRVIAVGLLKPSVSEPSSSTLRIRTVKRTNSTLTWLKLKNNYKSLSGTIR